MTTARRILEGSLKRLETDQIDLIHVHALMGADDLAKIEAKDGVLNALYKMRDEKLTRFVGITCHDDPAVLKTALERHDFDCVQMALNAALQEGLAAVPVLDAPPVTTVIAWRPHSRSRALAALVGVATRR